MDTSNTCHNPDKMDSVVTMVEKLLDKLADFEGKMNDKCDVVVSNQLDARLKIWKIVLQNKNRNYLIDLMHSKVMSQANRRKRSLSQ